MAELGTMICRAVKGEAGTRPMAATSSSRSDSIRLEN